MPLEGLDVGLGTLAGALLRGYTRGEDEEERRRQLEEQATRLGIVLPPAQERGYLDRVINPRGGQRSADMQEAFLNAYQQQLYKAALEERKQAAMMERQRALETQRQGGRKELKGMDITADRALAEFNKSTPQALTPQQLGAYDAAAAANQSRVGLNQARTGLVNQQTTLMDAFRNMITGGALPPGTPGAPGTPLPGVPSGAATGGTTPIPGAPGFEYGPPSLSIGGMTLTPRETIGRKAEEAAAVTRAREGAKALTGEAAANVSQIDALGDTLDDIATTAANNPNFLGIENTSTVGVREKLGLVSPEESSFYANVRLVVEQLTRVVQGSRPSDADRLAFQAILPSGAERDPQVVAAKLRAAQAYARSIVEKQAELATTPRSELKELFQRRADDEPVPPSTWTEEWLRERGYK